MNKKTPHLKKSEIQKAIQKEPVIFDAEGKVLGRAASEVAKLLIGKGNPRYSPFLTCFSQKVLVKNVEKVILTGEKPQREKKFWHTGFAGGIKEVTKGELLKKNPQKLFKLAVFGMLPKNKLRKVIIKNLTFA